MSLDRRFWRLYGSSATSNLADGIGHTALPLLAASFTRNPVLVSGLVSFAFLPWLLFALPSGALVDRMDRRHAMAAANVVRGLSTAVLAVLVSTHTAGIGALYVVAFALGLAETVYDSASRAILPQVVTNADLDRANSLLTVEETLGQTFLGAPVGSALFALAVVSPLLINAGGFAIAAVLVLTLRGSFRPRRSETRSSVRHDIKDGVRWLAAHAFLRSLTLVSAGTALAQNLANGVFVLYVLDVLDLPSGNFGLVLLVAGFGGLLGGLATPLLARAFGRAAMLVVGAVLGAVGVLGMSFTSNGYLGASLFGVSAFGIMIWNVITMSLRQALIPHELFGRWQGAYRTLVWGAIPIGALLGGGLAKLFGIPTVFAIAGVALLFMAGVLAVIVRRYPQELADQPAEPATSDRELSEGSYGVG